MSDETQDIVQELYDWADIIDGVQGKANVVMLSSAVFVDAAAEITLLREERDDLQVLLRGRTAELQSENERLRTAGNALADAVVVWYAKALPRTATTRLSDALAAWQAGGPS
jgi:hypothetical protein